MTKVFKFGGVSVANAAGIQNVAHILSTQADNNTIVVISAMGKTTNALERLTHAYLSGQDTTPEFTTLAQLHLRTAQELFGANENAMAKVEALLDELQTKLQTEASENPDYEYDQIVSFGELLSTTICSLYFNHANLPCTWTDARLLIRTNNTFREGQVDWAISEKKIRTLLEQPRQGFLLTQGFLGGTAEGATTTLGREGSDYSAAIFAYAANAESVTIWKDVAGLLNADPKVFEHTVKLNTISYAEATELAFYGASVIHPKTLKPLQNKGIPLYVKSFLHPEDEGSIIGNFHHHQDVPSYILKRNQVLISVSPKDFSFMQEHQLSTLFSLFARFGIKINLMQSSALSFSVCGEDYFHKLPQLIEALQNDFMVRYNEHMELLTIRHYVHTSTGRELVGDRPVFMEQRNRITWQMVMEEENSSK